MNRVDFDKWIEPDILAKNIAINYDGDIWAYLKSGQYSDIKDSKSIIGLFAIDEIVDEDIEYLAKNKLKNNYNKNYEDCYLTLLSYEYRHNIEENYLKCDKKNFSFPKSIFVKFAVICEFDHDNKSISIYHQDSSKLGFVFKLLNNVFSYPKLNRIKVNKVLSNFTYDEYYKAIEDIKEKISQGVCYQSNLTRKFYGNFEEKIDDIRAIKMFLEISNASPANYSSFIKYRDKFIVSNSPECFIKVKNGIVKSQPIKGTSKRSNNPITDFYNKKYLKFSIKEKAENLMIVDLVRNDLSLFSQPNSVKVDNLFKVDSYKSYHHLSTTISSKLSKDKDVSDIVKATFPPASMTGAPKISATNVAFELEKIQRGIYSGSIGLILGKKEANLSVVIRTLIIEGNSFEFQVGGAITIDSKADKEIKETYVKASQICKILAIKDLK